MRPCRRCYCRRQRLAVSGYCQCCQGVRKLINVINIIIQGAVTTALKRAIVMGGIIVMIRIMAIEKAVVMKKIVITMEACIFSYSFFSYYFWLVLSQHISMKIMTIKYLVKNYSAKSYLRRKKQNMAVM